MNLLNSVTDKGKININLQMIFFYQVKQDLIASLQMTEGEKNKYMN